MDPYSQIRPDEIVLRRIARVHLSDDRTSVMPDAFAPRSNDSGLSVFRNLFHSPAQVAREFRVPRPKAGPMWVARLRAADILALGLTIQPDPLPVTSLLPAQPGHALIPQINGAIAKNTRTLEWMRLLAALVTIEDLEGPFDPPPFQS